MPIDVYVVVEDGTKTLFHRSDVDHGKFAFIVPSPEGKFGKVKVAEAHRKMKHHSLESKRASEKEAGMNPESLINHDHRRRYLSVDEHLKMNHKTRSTNQDDEVRHNSKHENKFDLEDYGGIDDAFLEQEIAINQHKIDEQIPRTHSMSDLEREEHVFARVKFDICVSSTTTDAAKGKELRRRIRLLINKGETAYDFTRLAKKEHLTGLETSLRRVSSELQELIRALDEAKEMEDVLQRLNQNTNKRAAVLSMFSLFALFAAGCYQASFTKKFFKRKKIL